MTSTGELIVPPTPPRVRVQIGMDVGQTNDPTAVVVAEVKRRERQDGHGTEDVYLVRDLKRLPLGTPYPQVRAYVVGLVERVNLNIGERGLTPWLLIDGTGIGGAMIDDLRLDLRGQRVRLDRAEFTSGDRIEWVVKNGTKKFLSVGKMRMVARLQAHTQSRPPRIELPSTSEARALADELRDFEIRAAATHDVAGAFRVGAHDDLVTALGLATMEGSWSVYEFRGMRQLG
jgi:hypothetical protein